MNIPSTSDKKTFTPDEVREMQEISAKVRKLAEIIRPRGMESIPFPARKSRASAASPRSVTPEW